MKLINSTIDFDCILIPGGGLLSDGSLPPWTQSRLNLAVEYSERTQFIICLSGGTVHKPPPLSKAGYPLFESRAAGEYLINQGIDPKIILSEISSYDTIGNAYFSRLLFCSPLELKTVLVITSEFHLPRTREIFTTIFQLSPVGVPFELHFEGTLNQGLTPSALQARNKRERESLLKYKETQKKIKSMANLHTWIYQDHEAYAIGMHPQQASGDILDSY